MVAALGAANPSSIHADGRRARDIVERARDRVAALAGRPREQVVFTSGGTEANGLGVAALARGAHTRTVWTTRLEHPSLAGAVDALGWDVRYFDVDAAGRIVLPPVSPAGLVAVAWANHELGVIQDIEAIGAWAAEAGARTHVDAVQAVGKVQALSIPAASLAISAHKLGGPPGVGALVIPDDAGLGDLDAGHQERGRRPGTENVVGIAGFGAAAAHVAIPTRELADALERGLVERLGARIHGAGSRRTPTVNAGFPGARGESVVIGLDLAGISASTGAACTSGSTKPSPVLLALGLTDEQAREAVRFSVGASTTEAEIARVLEALPAIVQRARNSPRVTPS